MTKPIRRGQKRTRRGGTGDKRGEKRTHSGQFVYQKYPGVIDDWDTLRPGITYLLKLPFELPTVVVYLSQNNGVHRFHVPGRREKLELHEGQAYLYRRGNNTYLSPSKRQHSDLRETTRKTRRSPMSLSPSTRKRR